MNQEQILASMSLLPWRVVRQMLGVGLIRGKDDVAVLHPSFEPNEGMPNENDIEACYLAVASTFGSGILPEEVAEMKELLECFIQGVDSGTSHSEQAKDLLTRINARK